MGPKKDAGLKRGAEKKGNGGVRKKAKKVKTAEEEEAEIWEQVQQAHELDADIPTSPESEVSDEPEDEEIDDEEVDDEEFEDEDETEEKKVDVKKVGDEEVDDEEVDDEEVDDEELEDEDEAEEVDEKKVDVKKADDEEVDDEEVDDEELDDEEEDDEEGEKRELLFEFGAWPPDKGDEDGLVNILTQTFLRTDIDVKGAADLVIENSPHGTVIVQGPGPEEEGKEKSDDDEFDGMLYGLFTTLDLNKAAKDDAPKFVKDLFAYLLNKAKKGAPSEFYKRLEEIQSAADGKTALFINDRLLNFSPLIVPKSFSLLQDELDEKKMDYKTFIYIQKIRIAEGSDGSGSSSGKQDGEPPKKKGKMGKAEKKRAAAAALANADIEFDNVEDSYLFKLTTGTETHFDYPVHMDVEPGSKFHVVEKNGKKWNPFRRVVIMDANRMRKFLENGAEAIVESD